MVKINFGVPPFPTKKENRVPTKINVKNEKIKVVQNCLKWRENWSKMIFGLFSPHPKIFGGVHIFFVKNEKNQICSKFPEMARKLVENNFLSKK